MRSSPNEGYLFHFQITGNRKKIGVDDPRLEDPVVDNTDKFDITASESLLIGRDFRVGTDIRSKRKSVRRIPIERWRRRGPPRALRTEKI